MYVLFIGGYSVNYHNIINTIYKYRIIDHYYLAFT